jgi:hypothetical protein
MIFKDDPNADLSPDDVRAAFERVIAGPSFRQTPQLVSFLRFVVETALAGQEKRIKSYTIGIEALGRSESFDPQSDPIVRVEARRLRRALDAYYTGPGADDPVAIELPRGSYVPWFRRRMRASDRRHVAHFRKRISGALRRRIGIAMVVAIVAGTMSTASNAALMVWLWQNRSELIRLSSFVCGPAASGAPVTGRIGPQSR